MSYQIYFKWRGDECNSSYDIYHVSGKLLGILYKEVDGFFVFAFPNGTSQTGCFPEHFFTSVSDKLKEINAEWEGIVSQVE